MLEGGGRLGIYAVELILERWIRRGFSGVVGSEKGKGQSTSCEGRKWNDVSQGPLPCHGGRLQVAHQCRKRLFIYVLQILGIITAIITNENKPIFLMIMGIRTCCQSKPIKSTGITTLSGRTALYVPPLLSETSL